MNRTRTLVALAIVSLLSSGCCLVHTRKDTGQAYVLPVRQWSWMEWGCVLLVGCVVAVIAQSAEADRQLMPRDPCRFPDC